MLGAVLGAGFCLGIDFGTSNTMAMFRWPDGRTKPLLFDGSPVLSSAVCWDEAGLLVGRDARHAARVRPDRYEPNPKRRIDDGVVLLGDAEVPVEQLVTAVLRRVVAEAQHTLSSGHIAATALTYPAAWGVARRQVLVAAAAEAGIPNPTLMPEPVAAASYLVAQADARIPVGMCAVVYDFGAGTFDASVVRRTPSGFEVLASDGLPDAGGLDIDAAIVGYLGAVYSARDPGTWSRLLEPTTTAERRANRLLWEDVRGGKEALSRAATTLVPVPLFDDEAPLGRGQLELLARPIVDRTVASTAATIRMSGVDRAHIAGVFLVGGSSRLPLAATLLHRAIGIVPTIFEQPEIIVAEGSLHALLASPGYAAAPSSAPFVTSPMPAALTPAAPMSAAPMPATPISAAPMSAVPMSPMPMSAVPGPAAPRPVPTAAAFPPFTGATPPPAGGGQWVGPGHPLAAVPPPAPRRSRAVLVSALLVAAALLAGAALIASRLGGEATPTAESTTPTRGAGTSATSATSAPPSRSPSPGPSRPSPKAAADVSFTLVDGFDEAGGYAIRHPLFNRVAVGFYVPTGSHGGDLIVVASYVMDIDVTEESDEQLEGRVKEFTQKLATVSVGDPVKKVIDGRRAWQLSITGDGIASGTTGVATYRATFIFDGQFMVEIGCQYRSYKGQVEAACRTLLDTVRVKLPPS